MSSAGWREWEFKPALGLTLEGRHACGSPMAKDEHGNYQERILWTTLLSLWRRSNEKTVTILRIRSVQSTVCLDMLHFAMLLNCCARQRNPRRRGRLRVPILGRAWQLCTSLRYRLIEIPSTSLGYCGGRSTFCPCDLSDPSKKK